MKSWNHIQEFNLYSISLPLFSSSDLYKQPIPALRLFTLVNNCVFSLVSLRLLRSYFVLNWSLYSLELNTYLLGSTSFFKSCLCSYIIYLVCLWQRSWIEVCFEVLWLVLKYSSNLIQRNKILGILWNKMLDIIRNPSPTTPNPWEQGCGFVEVTFSFRTKKGLKYS